MCIITLNNELKGIELSFESKPTSEVLANIKSQGFRWHNMKQIWYAKQSEERIQFANSLNGLNENDTNIIQTETKTTKAVKQSKKVNTSSLWDRCKFEEGNTDTSKYDYKFVGSNYSGLSTKETAVVIRKELKTRFPECKFSVTSDYNSVDVELKSSPYEYLNAPYELDYHELKEWVNSNNIEINAIKKYVEKLVNSYNYDDSDSMTDYFCTHFYNNTSVSYEYKQTEQNEDIKVEIANFEMQKELFEQEEKERAEQEYKQYLKEQEEKQKAYEERQQVENLYLQEVEENAVVKELGDNETYFIKDIEYNYTESLRADNNTLTFSHEGTIEDMEINKEIHFSSVDLYNKFVTVYNNLHDISFLSQTGGSRTEDHRINSMTDYDNMESGERETVLFFNIGVAIYLNDKLMFVVDAQGHGYGKYTGLLTNATEVLKNNDYNKIIEQSQVLTVEEVETYKQQAESLEDISFSVITDNNLIDTWNTDNWDTYKTLIKESLKHNSLKLNARIIQQLTEENIDLKIAMYKLLKEVDGMQEQFKDADLQQGKKLTIFRVGAIGTLSTNQVTFDSFENSTFAQYTDVVKLIFKMPRKQGLYSMDCYNDLLIYDGWLELPKTVLYDVSESNGFIVSSSKYSSCDKNMYGAIIEHFIKQDKQPLINTHKPIF
jgi:putative lipoic acid-binding regulatory protein